MFSYKKIVTIIIIVLLSSKSIYCNVKGKITQEIIEETVERIFRRSGTEAIEGVTKKSAKETLEHLAKKYGDDVLLLADDVGFDFFVTIPKYGDDILDYAMKVTPKARKIFLQNIPDLLPLAKRVGIDAIELEAKCPGLAVNVFKIFGDDAGKTIAKNIPTEDIPRLLKYAEKADTPSTRNILLEAYKKEGKSLFERIPAKLILASGLSASMILGTHRATSPAKEWGEKIKGDDNLAESVMNKLILSVSIISLIIIIILLWRFNLVPWHKKSLSNNRGIKKKRNNQFKGNKQDE